MCLFGRAESPGALLSLPVELTAAARQAFGQPVLQGLLNRAAGAPARPDPLVTQAYLIMLLNAGAEHALHTLGSQPAADILAAWTALFGAQLATAFGVDFAKTKAMGLIEAWMHPIGVAGNGDAQGGCGIHGAEQFAQVMPKLLKNKTP